MDEEFRENHVGMLERFYQMFESVYKYIADLNAYIAEMADGTFVDYTIEVLPPCNHNYTFDHPHDVYAHQFVVVIVCLL